MLGSIVVIFAICLYPQPIFTVNRAIITSPFWRDQPFPRSLAIFFISFCVEKNKMGRSAYMFWSMFIRYSGPKPSNSSSSSLSLQTVKKLDTLSSECSPFCRQEKIDIDTFSFLSFNLMIKLEKPETTGIFNQSEPL